MTEPMTISYSEPCQDPMEAMRQVRERQDQERHAQHPRLTVGIPSYNRPEMLVRAVRSVLNQAVPAQIFVSDNSPDAKPNLALKEAFWAEMKSGRIQWEASPVVGLWPNWDYAARTCKSEFFMWLQNDDVIKEYVVERIIAAFDQFPEADTWMAPNKIALDENYHWWNNGNGPWVPLSTRGHFDRWGAEIFAPTCYFLSWSLSPGVAFRCGPRFTAALDWLPMDCEVFTERLILVAMAMAAGKEESYFVADPAMAGSWIQHNANQYWKSHDDQPRQSRILMAKLDEAMNRLGDRWQDAMATWCKLQHPQWILGWLGDLEHIQREGGKSRYGPAIAQAMIDSLQGRVKYIPRYKWWRRAINWAQGR